MKKALGNLIRVSQHLGCSYKEVEVLSPQGCIVTGQGAVGTPCFRGNFIWV